MLFATIELRGLEDLAWRKKEKELSDNLEGNLAFLKGRETL